MFKKTKSRPDGNVAPPTQTVQCDWEQRDFTQSITLGLSQLTDFLNNFGVCVPHAPTPVRLRTVAAKAYTIGGRCRVACGAAAASEVVLQPLPPATPQM